MATTSKKLGQHLKTVNNKLLEVKLRLIRCEPLDIQIIPLLRQIAETLQSIKSEGELIGGGEDVQHLLREARSGAEKARLLLHTAADLTCRSALAKSSIAGSYTPNGELPPLEFSGRIVVHA